MAKGAVLVEAITTKPEPVTPSISFILPQKGRLDLFEWALRSIALQELGAAGEYQNFEVVVVSQDETANDSLNLIEQVLGHVEAVTFKFIKAQDSELTISALRNQAARSSSGALLAFLDADISLSRNWAKSMSAVLMSDEALVLVSAMQVAGRQPTTIEKIQVELNRMRVDSDVDFLSGHNLLLSRETFEAVGGFPEQLRTCEDSVFSDSVARLGTLYRSSKASYVHLGEDRNLGEVFRKEKWRSYSNFATLIGRKVRAVELISFVAPMVVVFGLALSLILLLAGRMAFSSLLLLLALAPIFAYSTRLHLATKGRLNALSIIAYYAAYFVARGIGMTQGIGNAVRVRRASSDGST